ncbi:hypothetical protein E2P84_44410 [Burkholderia cepacia]|uniref:Immunity protein 30 domain-containing protein n=1 Tax=Burkholderia cepacia TaxID=292 RepID=A0AAX2RRE2_BURCE|nr:hypothetical protein [Burkholderia cepacia]TES60404.1 hypothetical protein E2P84_44410 [Burkholderia cepacia]TET01653.1 hypothetical protein E3D36_16595 [Burkholderia cepacia]TEU47511.1 hypothetical protein E3D37_16025 [Burkholderia cepacia]TEU53538.1 hypothetical protein E3D38_12415 [Burkholderia cepacia]TEV02144.1 hypothetical protein E3D40_13345 [Burkholderia cepacia]
MNTIYTDRFQDADLVAAVAALIDLARDYEPDVRGSEREPDFDTRVCIDRVCFLLNDSQLTISDPKPLVDAVRATLRYPANWVTPLLAAVEARAPGLMLQLISDTAVGERADLIRRINILEWMLPTERLDSLVIALAEYRSTHPVYFD